jgi:hypothetical protein
MSRRCGVGAAGDIGGAGRFAPPPFAPERQPTGFALLLGTHR